MADSITNPKKTGTNQNLNVPQELVSTNTTGTVEKGFVMASFLNSGALDVTVNGKTLEPGASKTYPYIWGCSYAELAWDCSGGATAVLTILVIY